MLQMMTIVHSTCDLLAHYDDDSLLYPAVFVIIVGETVVVCHKFPYNMLYIDLMIMLMH